MSYGSRKNYHRRNANFEIIHVRFVTNAANANETAGVWWQIVSCLFWIVSERFEKTRLWLWMKYYIPHGNDYNSFCSNANSENIPVQFFFRRRLFSTDSNSYVGVFVLKSPLKIVNYSWTFMKYMDIDRTVHWIGKFDRNMENCTYEDPENLFPKSTE